MFVRLTMDLVKMNNQLTKFVLMFMDLVEVRNGSSICIRLLHLLPVISIPLDHSLQVVLNTNLKLKRAKRGQKRIKIPVVVSKVIRRIKNVTIVTLKERRKSPSMLDEAHSETTTRLPLPSLSGVSRKRRCQRRASVLLKKSRDRSGIQSQIHLRALSRKRKLRKRVKLRNLMRSFNTELTRSKRGRKQRRVKLKRIQGKRMKELEGKM